MVNTFWYVPLYVFVRLVFPSSISLLLSSSVTFHLRSSVRLAFVHHVRSAPRIDMATVSNQVTLYKQPKQYDP
jgi:hypothetical protein